MARAEPATLTFAGLYGQVTAEGPVLSAAARALVGHRTTIDGFMAPPLKAESDFFVLTREPLAICPFCQSDADWPLDIIVVYLRGMSPLVQAGARVSVTGRLELGSFTDAKTGFVSQVRIVEAGYHGA